MIHIAKNILSSFVQSGDQSPRPLSERSAHPAKTLATVINESPRAGGTSETGPINFALPAKGAAPSDQHFPVAIRMLFAVGLGNALEFYDFITFSFFAIQIGHTFYPTEQTSHGLLFSLATFGAGFLTRPLGAVVIGRYGDRVGRKPAMMLSFTLMGVSIAGLALSPSYGHIGLAAPMLLVTFRLLQGFTMGGKCGPVTALPLDSAPPGRRELYGAIQASTQGAAI